MAIQNAVNFVSTCQNVAGGGLDFVGWVGRGRWCGYSDLDDPSTHRVTRYSVSHSTVSRSAVSPSTYSVAQVQN